MVHNRDIFLQTKAPSVVGSEDAVVNSDGEQFPQRTRGGDGVSQRGGRPRRGAHSGASGQSQRLPQRRDRTDRANNTNNRRHNANSHRRHPDEDDDDGNDFDGGNMANANNNTSSSGGNAGKSQQHNGSNNKGGSETTSTNGGSGGAPAGHQQKGSGDATDGCTTSNPSAPLSVKPRRHAHSGKLVYHIHYSSRFSSEIFCQASRRACVLFSGMPPFPNVYHCMRLEYRSLTSNYAGLQPTSVFFAYSHVDE